MQEGAVAKMLQPLLCLLQKSFDFMGRTPSVGSSSFLPLCVKDNAFAAPLRHLGFPVVPEVGDVVVFF